MLLERRYRRPPLASTRLGLPAGYVARLVTIVFGVATLWPAGASFADAAQPPLTGGVSTDDPFAHANLDPTGGKPEVTAATTANDCVAPTPAQVSELQLKTHWRLVKQAGDTCYWYAPFAHRLPGAVVIPLSKLAEVERNGASCGGNPFDLKTAVCQMPSQPERPFDDAGGEHGIIKPDCEKGPPGAYDPSANPNCQTPGTPSKYRAPAPTRMHPTTPYVPVAPNVPPQIPEPPLTPPKISEPIAKPPPPRDKRSWTYGVNRFDCEGGPIDARPPPTCTFYDNLKGVWTGPRYIRKPSATYEIEERTFHFLRSGDLIDGQATYRLISGSDASTILGPISWMNSSKTAP